MKKYTEEQIVAHELKCMGPMSHILNGGVHTAHRYNEHVVAYHTWRSYEAFATRAHLSCSIPGVDEDNREYQELDF